MGEFEKNQDKAGQTEQDDKAAFGQFDKDKQQQQGEFNKDEANKDEFADEKTDKNI